MFEFERFVVVRSALAAMAAESVDDDLSRQ